MNQPIKRMPTQFRPRRGVAILECAIVMPVLMFIFFAMLDLGLAAVRYNALANASRRIAREVILHGAIAPTSSGEWGPIAFSGTAASGSVIVASIQHTLPTMPLGDVNVNVDWPESDNSPRDPVRVEVSYIHQPIVPAISVWGPITLRSVSTMHVVN